MGTKQTNDSKKSYNAAYWKKNRERLNREAREFYVRGEWDHDKKLAAQKRYRDKHKEQLNTEARERYNRDIEKSRQLCTEKARRRHQQPRGRLLRLLNSARKRAPGRGLAYDLTIEWAEAQWGKQGGCCALTGLPFDLSVVDKRLASTHPMAPSLDQIRPSGGYTQDNVRIVSWHMNHALGEHGVETFEKLIDAYQKQKQKNERL